MSDYAIVHGGYNNDEAVKELEIFYKSDIYEGIIETPRNIGPVDVSNYGSFLDGDLFVVTGGNEMDSGIATTTISYMNISKLFIYPEDSEFEWDYQCVTQYNAIGQTKVLDDYLLNSRLLKFEVLDTDNTLSMTIFANDKAGGRVFISINKQHSSNSTDRVHIQYEVHDYSAYLLPMVADLDEISTLTSIDYSDKYTFWMQWDSQLWYVFVNYINVIVV